MKLSSSHLALVVLLSVLVFGCKKEEPFVNPFDDPSLQPPDTTTQSAAFDLNTFEGLHHYIFRPTCANSGCHDGTFEPDFRSVESSYNTMVFHPIIKNDTLGTYTYRVLPGDPDKSVLYQRLLVDIDGQSGVMPLSVDPGSDWLTEKAEYMDAIRQWIVDGAPDIMGNLPVEGNQLPRLSGVVGFAGGSSVPLEREPGNGPIEVPLGTTDLELWFAFDDPETPSDSLTHNKVKFSLNLNAFDGAPTNSLSIMPPLTEAGYFGTPVQYTHRIQFNVSSYPAGTVLFARSYIRDNGLDIIELPNEGSANYIKGYSAIVIK